MKSSIIAAALFAGWILAVTARAANDTLRIDGDFPGGNIIVDRIEGDKVYVHQDLRDTKGWWFYWYFRVRGAEGRTLTFHFQDRAIGVLGPAVSRDGGRTWQWLRQKESVTAFKHAFTGDEAEVRFSFAMPYQHADLQRFLARHAGNPHLHSEVFARTRKGTPVELLRVGNFRSESGAPFKVWITCRHHACEMMASYVLEGIIDETLANSDTGAWLRRNVDFLIVPMVDRDGVEAGDQGKNRMPHDHAADYVGPSIYPEVAALRKITTEWAGGRPHVTLDLHNPSIGHRVIYTHGLRADSGENPWNNAGDTQRVNARRFLDALEKVQRGPLPFRVQDSIDFAAQKAKQTAAAKTNVDARGPAVATAPLRDADEPREGPPTSGGLNTNPGAFRCTFEVPYALARDVEVNADTARAFGRDIARALHAYLEMVLPHPVSP